MLILGPSLTWGQGSGNEGKAELGFRDVHPPQFTGAFNTWHFQSSAVTWGGWQQNWESLCAISACGLWEAAETKVSVYKKAINFPFKAYLC